MAYGMSDASHLCAISLHAPLSFSIARPVSLAHNSTVSTAWHSNVADGLNPWPHVICRDGTVCGWREPPLRHFVGEPVCSVETNGTYPAQGATLNGQLYRVTTCELQYGPMNCDFIWGASNE